MKKHSASLPCPSCQDKVGNAHPYLGEWFERVQKKYPDCHIAWSYRDEKNQDEAFSTGKSRLKWPTSLHNRCKDGKPCAEALDLFQLEEGKAIFNPIFYTKLAEECVKEQDEIIWGGYFRSISDLDHFQYNPI